MSITPPKPDPWKVASRTRNPPASRLLPTDAVAALREAATLPAPDGDTSHRQRAIDETTQRIKAQYPQFFKEH